MSGLLLLSQMSLRACACFTAVKPRGESGTTGSPLRRITSAPTVSWTEASAVDTGTFRCCYRAFSAVTCTNLYSLRVSRLYSIYYIHYVIYVIPNLTRSRCTLIYFDMYIGSNHIRNEDLFTSRKVASKSTLTEYTLCLLG